MATFTNKPDLTAEMPGLSGKGLKLLDSLTAKKIWAETDLQYFFGNDTSLSLDQEFKDDYKSLFSRTPDAEFYFADLATRAFQMIDTVSRIDFSETTDTVLADQVLISAREPRAQLEGFFEFPGTSFHDGSGKTDSWSIGTFNSGLDVMTAEPSQAGDGEYANWTVLHEIGHSLGLKHTHQERNGLPPLDTVGKFMDNERYSVMSYKGASDRMQSGHAVSFMALDVAALQALYGAEDYAVGTSTYTLMNAGGGSLDLTENAVDIGRAYYCVWDSSGIDTLNYGDTNASVLINLNDATLETGKVSRTLTAMIDELKASSFYRNLSDQLQKEIIDPWHHAGGFFSRVLKTTEDGYRGTDGGFSIAHGAEIENANGGDMADLLIGNEGANMLVGLAGNDTLLGASGADRLIGDIGRDRLDGGKGRDILQGGGDADRFVFAKNYGEDHIVDFQAGDVIDLKDFGSLSRYRDVLEHLSDSTDGAVLKIGGDMLVIEGMTKAELEKADFIL